MTRITGSFLGVALTMLVIGAVASACSTTEQKPQKVELLSRHETIAEFVGISRHRCMGMTSLCPDKCGHSGTIATFKIIEYTKYEKFGKYGDPKTDRFIVMIENNLGEIKVPAKIRKAIMELEAGNKVELAWDHEYVTSGGSSAPERPIRKLKKQ